MIRSTNMQLLNEEIKRLYLDGLTEENVVETLKKNPQFNSTRRAAVQTTYRNLQKTLPKVVLPEITNTSGNDSVIFVGEVPISSIRNEKISQPATLYNPTEVPRIKKRRRVTMFHSLVALKDLTPSPEPKIDNDAEDLSSFIEIIVYDENGQEKRPEKAPIDFEADKENEISVIQKSVPLQELTNVKGKKKNIIKKNNRQKRVVIVTAIDPTLLKPPSVSCLKSANINANQVEKHFRFADTRNEAPLCDIKEVDYNEGIRYNFRQSTKKKVNFGEII